jgi:hypothetical protein
MGAISRKGAKCAKKEVSRADVQLKLGGTRLRLTVFDLPCDNLTPRLIRGEPAQATIPIPKIEARPVS